MLACRLSSLLFIRQIFETFSVCKSSGNGKEKKIVDLVPGGRDIEVTQENKHSYVQLVVEWRLVGSVRIELDAVLEGLNQLIQTEDFIHFGFEVNDLKFLLNGSPNIPIRILRQAAVYKGGYDDKSKPVEYLFAVLEELTTSQRSAVLSFWTGCSKLPLDEVLLQVVRAETGVDALPTSHTCFNQLVLPPCVKKLSLCSVLHYLTFSQI